MKTIEEMMDEVLKRYSIDQVLCDLCSRVVADQNLMIEVGNIDSAMQLAEAARAIEKAIYHWEDANG